MVKMVKMMKIKKMDNKLNKNLKTKITHQPQSKNTNILRINYQKKIIQKFFLFPGETFVSSN